MNTWCESLANWLGEKSGRSAGLWAALGLMIAAAVYVHPAVKATILGLEYAALSDDLSRTFSGSPVAFRILTPAISYLLGCHGHLIIITNLLIATALLATVYYLFRVQNFSSGDAFIAAFIMSFSLVTLTTIYCGGYTDSMTYLLVFLMWWYRGKRRLFYFLFLLALLNRESVLFLIPWFAYLQLTEVSPKSRGIIDLTVGYALTLSLYLAFRWWVGNQGEVGLGWQYYLHPLVADPFCWLRDTYPFCGLGLFSVFKLLWCIPILAGIDLWRRGARSDVYSMVLLTICGLSQLLVAVDSSRMLTLAFPVVLIGLLHLFRTNAFSFRNWAGYLLVGNLLVPQLYTGSHIVLIMESIPGKFLTYLIRGEGSW